MRYARSRAFVKVVESYGLSVNACRSAVRVYMVLNR